MLPKSDDIKISSDISVYQASLLQARAHRYLIVIKNRVLNFHKISMMEWIILGCIYDAGSSGVTATQLADRLYRSQSFITAKIKTLESKDFIYRQTNKFDSRSVIIKFKPKQKQVFMEMENDIKNLVIDKIYKRISKQDMFTYLNVLQKIVTD